MCQVKTKEAELVGICMSMVAAVCQRDHASFGVVTATQESKATLLTGLLKVRCVLPFPLIPASRTVCCVLRRYHSLRMAMICAALSLTFSCGSGSGVGRGSTQGS